MPKKPGPSAQKQMLEAGAAAAGKPPGAIRKGKASLANKGPAPKGPGSPAKAKPGR